MDTERALACLSSSERDCLSRYISVLSERLGSDLIRIWLFGSAARGEMWSGSSPMHSDIDILVLTSNAVPERSREELVNLTYPLFLECGRQIAPQFRTTQQFRSPEDERSRDFVQRIRSEGHILYGNEDP